jgi:hypothetical protein
MSARFERIGAVSGLLFVVVVIASFFSPETPEAEDPTGEIVSSIADDRTGLIAGAYLSFIASLLFLVFVSALWSRLRAAEPERGPSVLVLLGGLGSAVVILIAAGITLALVEAADEGREPEAVRALFELDNVVFIGIGITSAAFYAGVALSTLQTGSLPGSLGWSAAALAAVFPLALLGVFSENDEGGVLGAIFFIAILVNFVWILAASALMLREARPESTAGPPSVPPRQ